MSVRGCYHTQSMIVILEARDVSNFFCLSIVTNHDKFTHLPLIEEPHGHLDIMNGIPRFEIPRVIAEVKNFIKG